MPALGKLINQIIINTAHVKGTPALTRTSSRNLSYFWHRERNYLNPFLSQLFRFLSDAVNDISFHVFISSVMER